MYVIYHKFAGYLMLDGDYTPNIKEAWHFTTREDAEIEIGGYLERVEVKD